MATVVVNVPPFLPEAAMLDAAAAALSAAFRAAAPGVRSGVGDVARSAILTSPAYAAVLSGRLRHELGVVSPEPVLKAVADNVAGGVVVTSLGARRVGRQLSGGLRIEILKGDYSEVLRAPGGSFTSEGGFEIDWLRWLTLEGDAVVVGDYRFSAVTVPESRTGFGVMSPRGFWRVPPEYSGTAHDNWITRALLGTAAQVEAVVGREVRKAL